MNKKIVFIFFMFGLVFCSNFYCMDHEEVASPTAREKTQECDESPAVSPSGRQKYGWCYTCKLCGESWIGEQHHECTPGVNFLDISRR